MANVKITDLPSLSTMTDADVIPVVNVGTDTTEQITGANLKTYFTTDIANLSVTGDIVTGGNVNAGGGLDIDGDGTIGGNLFVTGNINFSGNVNQISGNSGSFYGNAAGVGALYAGIPVGYSNVVTAVIQSTADLDDYTQINAQNLNHGATSSMEYVVTGDLGTDTTDYIDIGFSSSTWDGTQTNSLGTAVAARDGWMYVQGGGGGGNLILGTTTAGRTIKFNAGGPNAANTVGEISNTGLTMTGIISSVGNVQAGNLRTAGLLSVTGTVTACSTISTSGTVIGGASLQASGMTALYSGTSQADTIGTAKTTGTITMGGTAQTGAITIGQSTTSQTLNFGSGVVGSGNTKAVNLGTGGAAGSTTNIVLGPVISGATGLVLTAAMTTMQISNTSSTALSVTGGISANSSIVVGTSATGFYNTSTLNDFVGLNKTSGDITVGSLSQTGTITIGRSTGNQSLNIASGTTGSGNTKTVNIGTGGDAGSTSNINIGPTTANAISTATFNTYTPVVIANVTSTALRVAGGISVAGGVITAALNLASAGTVLYNTDTTDLIGTSKATTGVTIGSSSGNGTIIVGQSTNTQTLNIAQGSTSSGNTKTVNIGTGGLANSTTTISVGPTTGPGTATFNTATTVVIANTGGTALSVAGTVLPGIISQPAGGTALYNTTTNALQLGASQTTGTITIGGANQTGAITIGQSTVTQTVLVGVSATTSGNTKTVGIGTAGLAGSTTNITMGPSSGVGTVNIGSGTAMVIANTSATSLSVAGGVTVAGNITGNTAGFAIGYLAIPQVTFSANATAALTDSGKHYYSTTAGTLELTIPTNANVAFPTGTALTVVVQAAGSILVTPQSGVTLYLAGNSTPGSRTVGSYGLATVMKLATNTWIINGTGVS